MTSERYAWLNAHPERQGRLAAPICGCGQDLEQWRHSHCPRCGTTLPSVGRAA